MIELTSEQNAWIRKWLIQQVSDLYDANIEKAIELLSDTDEKKLKLPFTVRMDFSSTTPKITTKVRCSKSWPDERVEEMADPNQPTFPGLDGQDATGQEADTNAPGLPGETNGTGVAMPRKQSRPKKSKSKNNKKK